MNLVETGHALSCLCITNIIFHERDRNTKTKMQNRKPLSKHFKGNSMLSMLTKPKHLIRAPLYWQQGKQVKRDTLRLPEAVPLKDEERRGVFLFVNNRVADDVSADNENTSTKPCHHLMVVGDSSAAGVGVNYQSQALIGRLLLSLYDNQEFSDNYSAVNWQLHATTGHDSFDVLKRLYLLPATEQPLDTLILVVGVNDAVKMQTPKKWLTNLQEIIRIAEQKFKPKNIIFTAIPPMEYFPALPHPLNQLMAESAGQLDQALQKFCADFSHIHYAYFDLFASDQSSISDSTKNSNETKNSSGSKNNSETKSSANKASNIDNAHEYFAKDGFHPNALTYRLWAEQLALFISRLSCEN